MANKENNGAEGEILSAELDVAAQEKRQSRLEPEFSAERVQEKDQSAAQLKSSVADIISAVEPMLNPADLPAADDAAKAQEELEKKIRLRNAAFREWLSKVVSDPVTTDVSLIQKMESLKNYLVLTPAEQFIFEKYIAAIRALQTVHEEVVEKLRAFSVEDFLEKPEEEQVQIVLDLYTEEYRQAADVAFAHAILCAIDLDTVYASHLDELKALPEDKRPNMTDSDIMKFFPLQACIVQGKTRFTMPLRAAHSSLISPHDGFKNLCDELTKSEREFNELRRMNPLCGQQDKNIDNSPRMDFLEDEKAEQFLSFLESDVPKTAYFRLLLKMHAQGPSVLKDNRRKSIFFQSVLDKIKILLPFFAQSIDELLQASKGKEDAPQTIENRELAFNTIFSLLLNILEPDFAAFTKLQEGLELEEEEAAVISVEPHEVTPTPLERLSGMFVEAEGKLSKRLSGLYAPSEKRASFVEPKSGSSEATTQALDLAEGKVTASVEPTDISTSSKPKPQSAQFEPQQAKAQSSSPKSNSTERISTLIGNAEKAISSKIRSVVDAIKNGSFIGKKSDICAAVPFIDYTRTTWGVVRSLQKRAQKDKTHPELNGFEFFYKRLDKNGNEKKLKRPPKHFRKGDFGEIRQNGDLVCRVIPQQLPEDAEDEASGVGIVVERHEEQHRRFAVRMMVAALTKENGNKIYVTVSDMESPKGRELALQYVDVILSEGALPAFQEKDNKGELRELSVEETMIKLEQMIAAADASRATQTISYRFVAERYKAEIDRIEDTKKEDEAFLKKLEEKENKEKVVKTVFQLGQITLGNRNLTKKVFVDKLVDYIQEEVSLNKNEIADVEKVKRELMIFLNGNIPYWVDESKSIRQITKELFNLAAKKLRVDVEIKDNELKTVSRQEQVDMGNAFLSMFQNFLEKLEFSQNPEVEEMPCRDSTKMIKGKEIAVELVHIVLIDKIFPTTSLINNLLAYVTKFTSYSVSSEQSEEIKSAAMSQLSIWLKKDEDKGRDVSSEAIGSKLFDFLTEEIKKVGNINQQALVLQEPELQQVVQPAVHQEEQLLKTQIETEAPQLQGDNLSAVTATGLSTEAIMYSANKQEDIKNLEKIDNLSEEQISLEANKEESSPNSAVSIEQDSIVVQEEPVQEQEKQVKMQELEIYDMPVQEEIQKEQVVQTVKVQISAVPVHEPLPKGQVSEKIKVRKDEALENSEDSVSNEQLATDVVGIATSEKAALLQENEELKQKIAQLQEMLAQKDRSATLAESSVLASVSAALGEPSRSIPQPPPPPPPAPNLNSALKPNTERAKRAVPAASNTTEPAMDLLTELSKGVILKPIAESASADRPLPPQKPSFEKELLAKVRQGASALHRASERELKLKPLPPQPETEGRKREKEMLAAVQKRQEDRAFLQEFDSLLQLQKGKLSTTNNAIIMRDPNTGEELDEKKVLTRLAQMGPISKGVSQDVFLTRIIQFAWISSNHDSNVLLTEEKEAELKIVLQQKIKHYFDSDKSERAPIGELALQMVNNVRANLEPGHDNKNMEKNGFWKKRDLSIRQKETSSFIAQDRPLLSIFGSPFYVNKTTAPEPDNTSTESIAPKNNT